MKYILLILLTTLCYTAHAEDIEVKESKADEVRRLRKERMNSKPIELYLGSGTVKSGDVIFKVESVA